MRLTTRSNADEVGRDLDRLGDAVQRASTRTANRLAEQAQVAGLREVDRVYGIGPRAFEKYVTTRLARDGEFEASLVCKGPGLPVYAFAPRPTRKGVSVRIKGRRFLIPHAFVARMRSGRVGVFARGAYGGKGAQGRLSGETFGRFAFIRGSKRVQGKRTDGKGQKRSGLPINELYTFAPPEAFASESVTKAMDDRVQDQLDKVAKQELSFALRAR